ncbi:hypothetical protein [uncultured Desulfobacter sp.]|uniref:hypothetical protein n=1 Tax=uncultured Desulfobacter sp. TaxID=240139 RepID=UPI002AAC31E5|nr:hypothetical protein [uncultured Desulfobacter sp.]
MKIINVPDIPLSLPHPKEIQKKVQERGKSCQRASYIEIKKLSTKVAESLFIVLFVVVPRNRIVLLKKNPNF